MLKSFWQSPWLKHGLWNTFEHGLTRVLDAAVSLSLLWFLSTEQFSKLALAQAWVAPLLFFFVAPETVLYREFGNWKAEGEAALLSKIRSLRRFAWGKAQFALVLSLASAWLIPGETGFLVRFYAMIWAFAVVLTPQIAGADREFLRLDLRLKDLSQISLVQKLFLLCGTWIAAQVTQAIGLSNLGFFALVAVLSLLLTAWMSRRRVEKLFRGVHPLPLNTVGVIREALAGFSIWNHLIGVVIYWIQTMDVFFLGLFHFPAREVGMYAAVLKLANFTQAIPTALGNLFSIRLGRSGSGLNFLRLIQLSGSLLGFSLFQGWVFWILTPTMIRILSHGRWSALEQGTMINWLSWILLGSILLSATFLFNSWLILMANIRKTLFWFFIPWGGMSFLIYGLATYRGGLQGAAQANVGVALLYFILLIGLNKRLTEPGKVLN